MNKVPILSFIRGGSSFIRGSSLALLLSGMPGCGDSGAAGPEREDQGPPQETDGPSDPIPPSTGWNVGGAGGESTGGGQLIPSTRSCPPDVEGYVLPGSGVEYCLAASSACETKSASCPLIVTFNTDGAYFSKVFDDVPVIVAELHGPSDGSDVKDQYAELPRVLASVYAGLDPTRVFAVGWSAGAGAAARGLCHRSKQSDFSEYGSTSDVYAGVLALGGCGCAGDYPQLSGNYHVLTFNGAEDIFGDGDSCEAGLRERAEINGCSNLTAQWQSLESNDPYAKNGDGSSQAERIHFGECERGEVVGYRGRDEGHVLSFKKHFDPKISGYDTAWNFLLPKAK